MLNKDLPFPFCVVAFQTEFVVPFSEEAVGFTSCCLISTFAVFLVVLHFLIFCRVSEVAVLPDLLLLFFFGLLTCSAFTGHCTMKICRCLYRKDAE